jgi:hypothetical protein
MKHFINLTSCVINKLHIVEIIKKQNMYRIYMNKSRFDGFMLFSSGSVSSTQNIIEICQKNNKEDYDIISNFIKEI